MAGRLRYSDDFRAQVLRALHAAPHSIAAVARAYDVSASTVLAWAREAGVKLPSAEERMYRGSSEGGKQSMRERWGDWETRRKKARALRAKGKSLREIAEKLGYGSEAAVSYAVRGEEN